MYKSMQAAFIVYVERSEVTGPTIDNDTVERIAGYIRYELENHFKQVEVTLDTHHRITAELLD